MFLVSQESRNMEFITILAWLGKVIAMFAAIAVLVLVIMAWAGPKMKSGRERDEKSQSVLQKCGRNDIRIQK